MKRPFLLASLILLAPVAAQDEVAPSREELRHEVRLRSGTALVGTLEPREFQIRTAFGELKVPVDEIKRVRFGRKAQPERLAEVEKAIGSLGSGNPAQRDHARAALNEAGAFGALSLKTAAKEHEDPEVRRLCKEILDSLEIESDEYVRDDDVIETSKFDLTGTIGLKAFKVNVEELGPLPVRRGDIVSIRRFKAEQTLKFQVTGQNLWPNDWLDTKVILKKGDSFEVRANGTLHFPNWGAQVFTPDGSPHMGAIAGMGIGTLAGRVGKSPPFRVGSNYSGNAPADGTLQLIVIMNVRGQPTTGGYTAIVRRGD